MCLLRVPGFATGDTFGSSGVGDMEILTGLFVRNALAHALSTGAAKASGAEANGDAGQSQPGAPSRPLAVFSARVQLEALTGGAQSVVAAAVSAASVALADAGMTSAHVGGGCAAVFTAASPLGPTEVMGDGAGTCRTVTSPVVTCCYRRVHLLSVAVKGLCH